MRSSTRPLLLLFIGAPNLCWILLFAALFDFSTLVWKSWDQWMATFSTKSENSPGLLGIWFKSSQVLLASASVVLPSA